MRRLMRTITAAGLIPFSFVIFPIIVTDKQIFSTILPKGLMRLEPGSNVTKLFTDVVYECPYNKLELLSLAGFSSLGPML